MELRSASVMIQNLTPCAEQYADSRREPRCRDNSFSWRSSSGASPQSPATADLGSACVSHAVFGVLPNTFRLGFSLKAARPKLSPWEGIGKEVGHETRPTATETVALPILSPFRGRPLKTSRKQKENLCFLCALLLKYPFVDFGRLGRRADSEVPVFAECDRPRSQHYPNLLLFPNSCRHRTRPAILFSSFPFGHHAR